MPTSSLTARPALLDDVLLSWPGPIDLDELSGDEPADAVLPRARASRPRPSSSMSRGSSMSCGSCGAWRGRASLRRRRGSRVARRPRAPSRCSGCSAAKARWHCRTRALSGRSRRRAARCSAPSRVSACERSIGRGPDQKLLAVLDAQCEVEIGQGQVQRRFFLLSVRIGGQFRPGPVSRGVVLLSRSIFGPMAGSAWPFFASYVCVSGTVGISTVRSEIFSSQYGTRRARHAHGPSGARAHGHPHAKKLACGLAK